MAIERFVWTDHAQARCDQRQLDTEEVERAIANGHQRRRPNGGRADWIVSGQLSEGGAFEAIYDHPHDDDAGAVRIVSAWRLDF